MTNIITTVTARRQPLSLANPAMLARIRTGKLIFQVRTMKSGSSLFYSSAARQNKYVLIGKDLLTNVYSRSNTETAILLPTKYKQNLALVKNYITFILKHPDYELIAIVDRYKFLHPKITFTKRDGLEILESRGLNTSTIQVSNLDEWVDITFLTNAIVMIRASHNSIVGKQLYGEKESLPQGFAAHTRQPHCDGSMEIDVNGITYIQGLEIKIGNPKGYGRSVLTPIMVNDEKNQINGDCLNDPICAATFFNTSVAALEGFATKYRIQELEQVAKGLKKICSSNVSLVEKFDAYNTAQMVAFKLAKTNNLFWNPELFQVTGKVTHTSELKTIFQFYPQHFADFQAREQAFIDYAVRSDNTGILASLYGSHGTGYGTTLTQNSSAALQKLISSVNDLLL